jgi:hypothetical protein
MNLVAKVFYIGNQVIQMSNQVAGVESLSDAAREAGPMGLVLHPNPELEPGRAVRDPH